MNGSGWDEAEYWKQKYEDLRDGVIRPPKKEYTVGLTPINKVAENALDIICKKIKEKKI